jgi:hypothetical protein
MRGTIMRTTTTVAATALLLAMFAAPVSATTTRVAVSGSQQVIGSDTSEVRTWMTGDTEHLRGLRLQILQFMTEPVPQVVNGTVTVNYQIDHATGEGTAWGRFHTDEGGGGFEGRFVGDIHFDATAPGGLVLESQVVGQGWGSRDGWQLRADGVEYLAIGAATFSGTMYLPGD